MVIIWSAQPAELKTQLNSAPEEVSSFPAVVKLWTRSERDDWQETGDLLLSWVFSDHSARNKWSMPSRSNLHF